MKLASSAKAVYNAITQELESNGITEHRLEVKKSGHPQVHFVFNGENHMVIFSGSPKHTGTQKSVSFVRRILSGQYQRIHRNNS
jgi:hypothetical protein